MVFVSFPRINQKPTVTLQLFTYLLFFFCRALTYIIMCTLDKSWCVVLSLFNIFTETFFLLYMPLSYMMQNIRIWFFYLVCFWLMQCVESLKKNALKLVGTIRTKMGCLYKWKTEMLRKNIIKIVCKTVCEFYAILYKCSFRTHIFN